MTAPVHLKRFKQPTALQDLSMEGRHHQISAQETRCSYIERILPRDLLSARPIKLSHKNRVASSILNLDQKYMGEILIDDRMLNPGTMDPQCLQYFQAQPVARIRVEVRCIASVSSCCGHSLGDNKKNSYLS